MKLILLVFLPLFFHYNCSPDRGTIASQDNQDSTVIISIAAVGDLMCHSMQYNYARVSKDSFDFNNSFIEVKKFLEETDFTFGNLETVIAGSEKGYSGYPFFNSPDDYSSSLKFAGFDLLSTANNHALDQGEKGVIRTIKQLKQNNLNYNGTFLSENDRDSIRIFDIKGIKIAFLSYTYGTNGIPIPKDKTYLINLIDFNLIENDIRNAKENGADLVLLHYHFGEEYKRDPTEYQKEVIEKSVRFGADIIIGSHPHVLQQIEHYKINNGKLDSGFIAYSLGNFISNQRWRYSDAGAILNFKITKNLVKDSIYLSGIEFIPTWVYKGIINKKREFVILPLEKNYIEKIDSIYSFLSSSDLISIKQAYVDTKEILSGENSKINFR